MSVLTIELTESLTEKLKKVAEKDKLAPEQFALLAIAEKLAVVTNENYLESRSKRADIDDFEKILARIPDVEAEKFDQIK